MNNPHRNHNDQADGVGNPENSTQQAVREEEKSNEDGAEYRDSFHPLEESEEVSSNTRGDERSAGRVKLAELEGLPILQTLSPFPRGTHICDKKKKEEGNQRAGGTGNKKGGRATVESTAPFIGAESTIDEKVRIETRSVQVTEARATLKGRRSDGCDSGDLCVEEEGGRGRATGVATADQSHEQMEEDPPLRPRRNEEDGLMVPSSPSSGNSSPSMTQGAYRNLSQSDEERGRATATGVATEATSTLELTESAEEETPLPPRRNEEYELRVPPAPISSTVPPSSAPGAYRVGNVSTMDDEYPTMDDESSRINVPTVVAYTVQENSPPVSATRIEDGFVDEEGANNTSPEDPPQPENSTMTTRLFGVDFRNRSVLMIFLMAFLAIIGLVVGLSVALLGGAGKTSSSSSAASTTGETTDPNAASTTLPTPSLTPHPTESPVPTRVPTHAPTGHPTSSPTIGPCGEGELRFELLLVTDQYPDETSWVLTDKGGNVVWQRDEVGKKNNTYFYSRCLEEDCFKFVIHDSEGDGICCDHGEGRYSINVDGKNIKRGGEFTRLEQTLYSCPTSSPTSSPSYVPTDSPIPTAVPTTANPTPPPTSVPTKTSWLQVGNDIDGIAENDWFGASISLSESGGQLAVAAYNHNHNGVSNRGLVRVFKEGQGRDWILLGDDLLGDSAWDWFGFSMSISENGERLAVGAVGHDSWRGQAKIFEYESGNWNLLGSPLVGEADSDEFGYSVSLSFDGSIVAVGARYNDGINGYDSGQVRIFQYESGSWTQVGDDIDGESAYDFSGRAVSLSSNGHTVAIGAPYNDGKNGSNSGHVRVYTYKSGGWKQVGQDIDGEAADDQSGGSVSLSANGNIVAIGAPWNEGTNDANSRHVRVYEYDQGKERWSQLGSDIDGEEANDWSGQSISLSSDGSVLAVGAHWNNGNGIGSGHVRIHKFDGNDWVQIGNDIDGEAAGDQSGYSVSLSGDGNHVAIGAPYNDGNSNSGHARVYNRP